MTPRERIEQAKLLVADLGVPVVEWVGYALDAKHDAWAVVQLAEEPLDPERSDQDDDASYVRLELSVGAYDVLQRDLLALALRELMRRNKDFRWAGSRSPAPEVGASPIFETIAAYEADL